MLTVLVQLAILFIGLPLSCFSASWQTPDEEAGISIAGSSDGSGNAVRVWYQTTGFEVFGAYFTDGAWGPGQLLSAGEPVSFFTPVVDFQGSTAVALWIEEAGDLRSSYFNGSSWNPPSPDPLATVTGTIITPSVSVNPSGQAVAVWIDSGITTVNGAFFSSGNWGAPAVIGTGSTAPFVSYSASGTAVAVWDDAGTLRGSYSIAGVWQPAVPIGTIDSNLQVGTDAEGRAIAAWIDPSGNVLAATFNGTAWGSPTTVASGPGNKGLSLDVAPGGTAVLTWMDAARTGFASAYNGTVWGPPMPFASDLEEPVSALSTVDVSVDAFGNALIVYATDANEVLSVQLPLGSSVFAPPVLVFDSDIPILYVISTSTSGGKGFAFWRIDCEVCEGLFSSEFLPSPVSASGFTGRTAKNKFASQTDRIHTLHWVPSVDPTVVAYYLRRNGALIAVIPAKGPYTYLDHNRFKHPIDRYVLTSVDQFGNESSPMQINLD